MDSKDLKNKLKHWKDLKYFFPYSELTGHPKWRVVILTCMDCRIISNVFGVEEPGEVTIIRNAGALLTPDSLRSILVAIYELEVNLIAVIGHTDCGGCMSNDEMETLLSTISKRTKISHEEVLRILGVSSVKQAFLGFSDVTVQVKRTVKAIQTHPLISSVEVNVLGYIYDTKSGEIIKI
jgi:carbonic anhydrase